MRLKYLEYYASDPVVWRLRNIIPAEYVPSAFVARP